MRVKELKNHEETCEYGLVKCPIFSCQETIHIKKILEHIEETNHTVKYLRGENSWVLYKFR
jgi:hypothetical protein